MPYVLWMEGAPPPGVATFPLPDPANAYRAWLDVGANTIYVQAPDGTITALAAPAGSQLVGVDITDADSPYTVPDGVAAVFVDCTAGDVTVTLPASPPDGRQIVVKKIDDTTNVLTIARNGADIEGAAADLVDASDTRPSYTLTYRTGGNWWWVV